MPTNHPQDSLRGLLFPVDGHVQPLAIAADDVLAALYAAIRCTHVEVLVLDDEIDLWCDEESLLRAEPQPNRAWVVGRGVRAYTEGLFGNVVALGRTPEGATRSLTVQEAEVIFDRVIGVSAALAEVGDARPGPAALARWLHDGIDWRN